MNRPPPPRPSAPSRGSGSVRIIGGRWRGTKLPVPDIDGLRPTSDRVRETLFNWLQPVLADSRVLDLFAGSGAPAWRRCRAAPHRRCWWSAIRRRRPACVRRSGGCRPATGCESCRTMRCAGWRRSRSGNRSTSPSSIAAVRGRPVAAGAAGAAAAAGARGLAVPGVAPGPGASAAGRLDPAPAVAHRAGARGAVSWPRARAR